MRANRILTGSVLMMVAFVFATVTVTMVREAGAWKIDKESQSSK